jgi:arylsulfatase A-like enzyme
VKIKHQHYWIVSIVGCLAVGGSPPAWSKAPARTPPNILLLLCDDLGYGDLGCYGHPTIRTPVIDRMAADGIRFTQFYSAAAICSPSRAALLTGRLPIRSGLNRVLNPASAGGIPDGEITIAQALKAKGYATACIGKWHLGHRKRYRPIHHGFDHYFGLLYSNDMKPLSLYRNDAEVNEHPVDQSSLTERYTDEAIRFIKATRHGDRPRPFFIYLPYTMPHVPLAVTKRFAGRSRRGLYGDVVQTIDWSVGQIQKTLRDEKIADNTLIVFTSDNGPWLSQNQHGGSAGLLREGKGTTWEGGVREPCIAWWPGHIKPGQVTGALASTTDLFPTCLELAGVPLPGGRIIDGESLLPVFAGGKSRQQVLFFYWLTELTAVRKGPWKLHFKTQGEFGKGAREHHPPLLFQVEKDPSEKYDVAREHPDVIAAIIKEVERHKAGLKPGKPQT